jgi:hypothetical protein
MPSIKLKGSLFIDKKLDTSINKAIIESALYDNEQFFSAQYKKPIKVVICKNYMESARVFKLFKSKSSGFAFYDNLVIINYENMEKLHYTIKAIIQHETNHILIKQHIKSLYTKILVFPNRSLWFSEGIANYNQGLVICTKAELKSSLQNMKIGYDLDKDNIFVEPRDNRLEYGLYYWIISDLVNEYGIDKLRTYIKLMINGYSKSKRNFYETYGSSIMTIIEKYNYDSNK